MVHAPSEFEKIRPHNMTVAFTDLGGNAHVPSDAELRQHLLHEMAHAVAIRTIDPELLLPPWLDEGSALWLTERAGLSGDADELAETLRDAIEDGAWIPLPAILNADSEALVGDDQLQVALIHAEAAALVRWLDCGERQESFHRFLRAAAADPQRANPLFAALLGEPERLDAPLRASLVATPISVWATGQESLALPDGRLWIESTDREIAWARRRSRLVAGRFAFTLAIENEGGLVFWTPAHRYCGDVAAPRGRSDVEVDAADGAPRVRFDRGDWQSPTGGPVGCAARGSWGVFTRAGRLWAGPVVP